MCIDVGTLIEEIETRFKQGGLFYGHGTDNPWDEAVALVLGVSGFPDDKEALIQSISCPVALEIQNLATRRIDERIPLAYLLGKIHFAGLEFAVEPGVVIPRSPIGQLVTNRFKPWLSKDPRTIVDVCCGCGCIGIACAYQFPEAEILLIDNDPFALELARRNIELHGCGDRVTALASDLFAAAGNQAFDLVVTNPPYVDTVDMLSLPAEYRHEPESGLAAGDAGLDVVDRLLEALPERLTAQGVFVCEVGASSPALLRKYPHLPFIWPDLTDGEGGVFLLESADGGYPGV